MSLQDQRYSYLLDKIKCLKRQVCSLEDKVNYVIPTYADDAAAGLGGLDQGKIYSTISGDLKIKL